VQTETERERARRLRARRRRTPGLAVALLLVAAAIAGGYWWTLRDASRPDAIEPGVAPVEVAEQPPATLTAPAVEPVAPAAEIELPPLDASDAFLRERVGALSAHPALAQWLAQSDLASRFAASVDNVADGRIPRAHADFLRPSEPFRALGAEPALRVDPASYARWDAIGDVVASVDAGAAGALYRQVAPLFQEAYRVLGYPDRDFETRAIAAIDHLLAAPVLEESPPLVAHVNRYKWADPAIEQLSPAQKQLLRMGPRNVERIQSKLRALRAALGAEQGEAWRGGEASE
jgi:hypothetical protein